MTTQLGSAYGQIILDASGVHAGVRQAQGALGGLQSNMAKIGGQLTTKVTLPLVGVGAAGAKVAKDFESQMATLSIAARSSGTSLEDLRKSALKTGADTRLVGISAAESAEAMENFYKAGLDTSEVFGDLNGYMEDSVELGGALRAAIDLAAASELDLAQASDVVAVSMATFGLEADQAVDIVNNFVQSADASVADVGELADAMANVGPTAAAFGWGLEDVNTALAILSERGIRGAEAGTALKSMMTNIMRPTDQVKEALAELNVALYDTDGRMRSLPAILADFETALSGVSEEQRNQYVQTLAGTYGMKAMNTLLAEGAGGWQEMEDAIASAATAQDVAAAKADTFAGTWEAFEGTLETFLIQVGTPLINDFLRPVVEWGTKAVETFTQLPEPVQQSAVAFGLLVAGIGPALSLGGKLIGTFGTLASGAKLLATGVIALPGLIGDVAAGLALIRGGAGAFSVAGAGAAGLMAALLPLAVAAGSLYLVLKASREYTMEFEEGMRQVGEAARQTEDDLVRSVVGGRELGDAMSDLAQRSENVDAALHKSGNVLENLAAARVRATKETEIWNEVQNAAHNLALKGAGSYRQYIDALNTYNDQAAEGAKVTEVMSLRLWELIRGGREADGAIDRLAVAAAKQAGLFSEGQEAIMAEAEAMTSYDSVLRQHAQNYRPLATGAEEATAAIEGLGGVQEKVEAITIGASDALSIAERAFDDMGMEAKGSSKLVSGLELALGDVAPEQAKLAANVELVSKAFAAGAIGYDEYVAYMGQATAGTLRLTGAQQLNMAIAVDQYETYQGLAVDANAILGQTQTQMEAAGWTTTQMGLALDRLGVSLGTTSTAQIKMRDDVRLVTEAFAEGTLSEEAYIRYMKQAEAGTLELSGAQRDGISSAMEYARAQRESAEAAEAERLGTIRLAESLKDASAARVAGAAIERLDKLRQAEIITMDQYEAAVMDIQDAYGLVTPESRALAEGMAFLDKAVEDNLLPMENYRQALDMMREQAKGGALDQEEILEEFGRTPEVVDPASQSLDGYGKSAGAVALEIDGIATGADPAIQKVGELGDTMDEEAGAADNLSGSIGGIRRELEDLTASEWTIRIGTSGTLPPGVEPVALATGAWNIPNEMLALLHPGEMVLPAELAESVRGMLDPGSAVAPTPATTGEPTIVYDQRQYSFPAEIVGSEVDLDMFAHRVLSELRERN